MSVPRAGHSAQARWPADSQAPPVAPQRSPPRISHPLSVSTFSKNYSLKRKGPQGFHKVESPAVSGRAPSPNPFPEAGKGLLKQFWGIAGGNTARDTPIPETMQETLRKPCWQFTILLLLRIILPIRLQRIWVDVIHCQGLQRYSDRC